MSCRFLYPQDFDPEEFSKQAEAAFGTSTSSTLRPERFVDYSESRSAHDPIATSEPTFSTSYRPESLYFLTFADKSAQIYGGIQDQLTLLRKKWDVPVPETASVTARVSHRTLRAHMPARQVSVALSQSEASDILARHGSDSLRHAVASLLTGADGGPLPSIPADTPSIAPADTPSIPADAPSNPPADTPSIPADMPSIPADTPSNPPPEGPSISPDVSSKIVPPPKGIPSPSSRTLIGLPPGIAPPVTPSSESTSSQPPKIDPPVEVVAPPPLIARRARPAAGMPPAGMVHRQIHVAPTGPLQVGGAPAGAASIVPSVVPLNQGPASVVPLSPGPVVPGPNPVVPPVLAKVKFPQAPAKETQPPRPVPQQPAVQSKAFQSKLAMFNAILGPGGVPRGNATPQKETVHVQEGRAEQIVRCVRKPGGRKPPARVLKD